MLSNWELLREINESEKNESRNRELEAWMDCEFDYSINKLQIRARGIVDSEKEQHTATVRTVPYPGLELTFNLQS